mgnify:CR=1 FL=1
MQVYCYYKVIQAYDAIAENKELMKKSMIDGYFQEQIIQINNKNLKVNIEDNTDVEYDPSNGLG